ncbi:hypothetical protein BKA70DRAFT_1400617 [Coprinopsis sp. MPI-PUGE-AT-0042]|nr:hypothetical protein BKA70DRAFT_1400617 [Coprinopsis sp. MPI-PUGE-AT-0042]
MTKLSTQMKGGNVAVNGFCASTMAFWSHGVYDFAECLLLEQARFSIIEDVVSLFVLACFSVIQAQIALQLVRHLRRTRPRRRTFALVNVALSAGYIICTIIWMANLCLKLQFVTRFQRMNESGPLFCRDGYIPDPVNSALCRQVNSATAEKPVNILNWVTSAAFQVMLVLADSLLIYRCYIILERPWAWIVAVTASLPLLVSLGLSLAVFGTGYDRGALYLEMISVYLSVLTNLIVSPTLILCLWREKRDVDSLLGDSRVGKAHVQYTRIIRTLVESASPPLALGLVHIVLVAAFQVNSPLFNLIWITFTILAPQTIALRAVQGRDSKTTATSSSNRMTSIAFDVQTRLSITNEEHPLSKSTDDKQILAGGKHPCPGAAELGHVIRRHAERSTTKREKNGGEDETSHRKKQK